VTVIDQFADFEREVRERHAELWLAGLPPRALATARMLLRWRELDAAGRLQPTALAAVRAYQQRDPGAGRPPASDDVTSSPAG
jgi:hypothetical protein